MKELGLIFLLFTSSANANEDSLKAINNVYIELSVGFGIFRSGEGKYLGDSFLSDRNHFTFIQTNKVFYRNNRIKGGGNLAFLYTDDYLNMMSFVDVGVNLFAKDAYPQFFGPNIAFGYFFDNNLSRNLGQRFIKFGVDYYHKKLHLAANFQWIAFKDAPFRKDDNLTVNLYLEIGYSFNLESFKRKQK